MKLDAINYHILRLLQENARISNAQISRNVGVTSPAVAERIRKMEDAGVIKGYTTKLSHYDLGYQLRAIITLRAFMGRLKAFLEKVQSFDEVTNCYRITGNENIVMEVVLDNQKHLEQFIDQLITYGETKTQIILSGVIEGKSVIK